MTATISRPAMPRSTPMVAPPGGTKDTQQATCTPSPILPAPAGAETAQAQVARESVSPMLGSPPGLALHSATDSRPATRAAMSIELPPGGTEFAGRHVTTDAQHLCAASDQPADRHVSHDARDSHAVGSDGEQGRTANGIATTKGAPLSDPALELAAVVLDDLERVKIANENRLRQLTRSVEDSDGEMRGFGLDESHPDVARLAAIVAALAKVEHDAVLQLQRQLRKHPLGSWMASQKGIGPKQGARLLATIGDPYIRPELVRADGTVIPEGPRTVSALWAYCGYHVVPASENVSATQNGSAVGDGGDPGQMHCDTQGSLAGVAPKRQRNVKANWNATAKMRAYLIAEKVIQCGNPDYRAVYDRRKEATEDRTHVAPCVRCGPKGKPAPVGSPWSKAHRHADALRVVAKEVLKRLWREAKRIHEDQPVP